MRVHWIALLVVASGSAGAASAQTGPSIELGPAEWLNAEFSRVTSVRQLAGDRLLVADRQENRLLLIDWDDDASVDIGRTGAGPGEYGGVGWLYSIAGDSSILTDPRYRRWHILAGAQIVSTLPANYPPTVLLGTVLAGADTFGHVLGVRPLAGAAVSPIFPDSQLLVLIDRSDERTRTVARLGARGRHGITKSMSGSNVRIGPNPLAGEDMALLFPDGWIAIVYEQPYRVDWRSPDGMWRRGEPLPFRKIPVNSEEKCAATQRMDGRRVGECEQQSLGEWPEYLPPMIRSVVPALVAAPDGRILIRRVVSAGANSRRYDVVDRSGHLSATLTLSAGDEIVGSSGTFIYVVRTGELGLQRLRRHPWP